MELQERHRRSKDDHSEHLRRLDEIPTPCKIVKELCSPVEKCFLLLSEIKRRNLVRVPSIFPDLKVEVDLSVLRELRGNHSVDTVDGPIANEGALDCLKDAAAHLRRFLEHLIADYKKQFDKDGVQVTLQEACLLQNNLCSLAANDDPEKLSIAIKILKAVGEHYPEVDTKDVREATKSTINACFLLRLPVANTGNMLQISVTPVEQCLSALLILNKYLSNLIEVQPQ